MMINDLTTLKRKVFALYTSCREVKNQIIRWEKLGHAPVSQKTVQCSDVVNVPSQQKTISTVEKQHGPSEDRSVSECQSGEDLPSLTDKCVTEQCVNIQSDNTLLCQWCMINSRCHTSLMGVFTGTASVKDSWK